MLLHYKIIIRMDSDEEKNNEMGIYQQFLYQEGKQILKTSNNKPEITIGIFGWESRGSGLKKHTAYRIQGEDRNGSFEVWRRFNQFNEMRICLVRAWPGCLIPSLPSKNPLTKNQDQISKKRARYLNDFLKKMALRPFLYYSNQFQALLRSSESNLSDTFAKWPSPTMDQIVNRYKSNFGTLAGREINHSTIEQIFNFHSWLEHNQKLLIDYRQIAKEMAFQRDRLNKYYLQFFKTAKSYEQAIMTSYTQPQDLIYASHETNRYQKHQELMAKALQANPYWLLYDLIKNEERDARAFAELIKSIERYADKTKEVQQKIQTNVKGISGTTAGKVTIKTIGMKGTAEQIKYQLQMENENLKKEKQVSQMLRDIIVALVCYIEIREYKVAKKHFYEQTIHRLARYDEQFVVIASKVWEDLQATIEEHVERTLQKP